MKIITMAMIGVLIFAIGSFMGVPDASAQSPDTNPIEKLDKLEAQVTEMENTLALANEAIERGANNTLSMMVIMEQIRQENAALKVEVEENTSILDQLVAKVSSFFGRFNPFSNTSFTESDVPAVVAPASHQAPYEVAAQRVRTFDDPEAVFDLEGDIVLLLMDAWVQHNNLVTDVEQLALRDNDQHGVLHELVNAVNGLIGLFESTPDTAPDGDNHNT